MEIVYLKRAQLDLTWMREYYSTVFTAGSERAREHFLSAEKLLLDYPEIGHETEFDNVRQLTIKRTPFSFIYRLTPTRIEVLRIWDGRADPAKLDL